VYAALIKLTWLIHATILRVGATPRKSTDARLLRWNNVMAASAN
jgi:hypothetical protein